MSSHIARYLNIFFTLFSIKEKEPEQLKQGKWKEFNKHAVLIAEGNYLNGQKHGRWREYFDSGELMIEEDFEHGKSHGRFASYHRNGRVLSEGNFQNGFRNGEFKVFDEKGNHIKSLCFNRDYLIEELELK